MTHIGTENRRTVAGAYAISGNTNNIGIGIHLSNIIWQKY